MKIKNFLPTVLAVIVFTACDSDDSPTQLPEEEQGDYSEGIFILNEGNFGSGNSSVSFLEADFSEIHHNIFDKENDEDLGDTGQTMAFYEDYAFIVVNVSNKIEVVDRNTFKSIATIDAGLDNPRHLSFAAGKAFVSNWGDGEDSDDDFIAVFDTDNFSLEENIEVEEGPEKIITANEKVYVAHQGAYGFNNVVSVINAASNEVVDLISVGDVPNGLATEGNFLWVSSAGLPEYSGTETAGKIQKINLNSHEVEQEFTFADFQHPSNLILNGGEVFYTLGKELYSFHHEDDALPETAALELEEVEVVYGLEITTNAIFAASANIDFTGNGELFIYNRANGEVNSFETGINPNGIFPNN